MFCKIDEFRKTSAFFRSFEEKLKEYKPYLYPVGHFAFFRVKKTRILVVEERFQDLSIGLCQISTQTFPVIMMILFCTEFYFYDEPGNKETKEKEKKNYKKCNCPAR